MERTKLTQRRPRFHIMPQQVAGAQMRQLGKPAEEALGLCALAHAGCTDKNDAGGLSYAHDLFAHGLSGQ